MPGARRASTGGLETLAGAVGSFYGFFAGGSGQRRQVRSSLIDRAY